MAHVSKRGLERFLRGETSRQRNRQIVRHLLRCELCGSLAFKAWRRSFGEHDTAIERSLLRKVLH